MYIDLINDNRLMLHEKVFILLSIPIYEFSSRGFGEAVCCTC